MTNNNSNRLKKQINLQALDQVIAVAQQNGVRLLLSLVNNWEDYGGKAQYVAWACRAGQDVSLADDFFTNPTCRQYYKDHVTVYIFFLHFTLPHLYKFLGEQLTFVLNKNQNP